MKLKYKGIIVIITMAVMCIGLLIFQLTAKKPADEKKNNKTQAEQSGAPAPSSAPEIEDDGTELLLNAYPKINELVKKYTDATVNGDMDVINSLVSDPGTINEEQLHKENENIEEYKNIDCYTLKGPEEGSFVVYVYKEAKIVNIDTLAPALTRLYVCTKDDGSFYINIGEVDDAIKKSVDNTENNVQVIHLIQQVDQKLEDAKSSDTALKAFMDHLKQAPENSDDNKKTNKDTKKKDKVKKKTSGSKDTKKK